MNDDTRHSFMAPFPMVGNHPISNIPDDISWTVSNLHKTSAQEDDNNPALVTKHISLLNGLQGI